MVVSKDGSSGTRTGFELVANEYAGETELPSDMEKYEWTLTKSDGKWLIGTPTDISVSPKHLIPL